MFKDKGWLLRLAEVEAKARVHQHRQHCDVLSSTPALSVPPINSGWKNRHFCLNWVTLVEDPNGTFSDPLGIRSSEQWWAETDHGGHKVIS